MVRGVRSRKGLVRSTSSCSSEGSFNRDGRKDVLFGMVGEGPSRNYAWPPLNADRTRDPGILYYPNVGTDSAPVPRRPPLGQDRPPGSARGSAASEPGDFVDWDGDGARDLIVCEFENL